MMVIRPPKARRAAAIRELRDETTRDRRTGAVRSVQGADVVLTESALREVWSPAFLERLARTYWRFLARITLGLVHVHYSEGARSVVLLVPAIKLITFAEPEYTMDAEHGLVRWWIERGLLVARRRHTTHPPAAGDPECRGHLQIEVRRLGSEPPPPASAPGAPAQARLRIEIEVANFYPAIAFALSRRLYDITQSRIHVLVTRAFLRSLVRRSGEGGVPKLAVSKVGRLAAPRDAPATDASSEPPAAQAS
jgi:hypothetical protein